MVLIFTEGEKEIPVIVRNNSTLWKLIRLGLIQRYSIDWKKLLEDEDRRWVQITLNSWSMDPDLEPSQVADVEYTDFKLLNLTFDVAYPVEAPEDDPQATEKTERFYRSSHIDVPLLRPLLEPEDFPKFIEDVYDIKHMYPEFEGGYRIIDIRSNSHSLV